MAPNTRCDVMATTTDPLGFHRTHCLRHRPDYLARTAPAAKPDLLRGCNGLPPDSADERSVHLASKL
jgi:hypothetical protein